MKIHFGKNESKYDKAPSVKDLEIWSQCTGGAIKDFLEIRRLENIPQMAEKKMLMSFMGVAVTSVVHYF